MVFIELCTTHGPRHPLGGSWNVSFAATGGLLYQVPTPFPEVCPWHTLSFSPHRNWGKWGSKRLSNYQVSYFFPMHLLPSKWLRLILTWGCCTSPSPPWSPAFLIPPGPALLLLSLKPSQMTPMGSYYGMGTNQLHSCHESEAVSQ